MESANLLLASTSENLRRYLQDQLVVIIHEYPLLGLCKIRYIDDNEEFIIDSRSLTETPVFEHTLSIQLFGGTSNDS